MAKRRLSKQQRSRIQALQERRRAHAQARIEQQIEAADLQPGEPRQGIVVTRHGQNLAVSDEQGELIHCLFRQNIGDLVCGDRVLWQATAEGEGVVTARLERSSALIRPTFGGVEKALAANITQLVVVLAPEPPPSRYLTDQYLVAAEQIGIDAIIALNKCDLIDPDAPDSPARAFGVYERIGYPLVQISAKHEHGLDPLIERLRNQTSILVGQSGVGKSSLINALLPDLELQTGRLSRTSGLGCHTTSATTLYQLPGGGCLIDSPGVRSVRLGQLDRRQLAEGFREFRPFLGLCRFSNCSHRQEPGCALKEAVAEGRIDLQRLENYLHMADNLPAEH